MNYVISVVNPNGRQILLHACEQLGLPVTLALHGRGTATRRMLDRLGLESREKWVIMTVADEEKTEKLIEAQRMRLYIDAPGNGICITVPVKSVGGGRTLAFLTDGPVKKQPPRLDPDYELILAIANEGSTDQVMDAARAAGASGGTVLHAKGTGAASAEKFFQVSIAQEKEIVLIVARASEKAEIMRRIVQEAGPGTQAGAIVFSLPVSGVAGFGMAKK